MTDTLEELADKADAIAARFREPATFDLVRAALNEAGVLRARHALADSFDQLGAAQARKRDADLAERAAKDAIDRALVDADWALEPPDANDKGVKLLAADKAAWKKREAAKDPRVAEAAVVLREAEHASAEARDLLTLADKRISACRADLDAAVATLNALALALPARKGATS